jgi:type I restriction enzyme, R subunit
MASGHGRADYLLYVNRRVVGVIEAKPIGTPLSGVEWQSVEMAGAGHQCQVASRVAASW